MELKKLKKLICVLRLSTSKRRSSRPSPQRPGPPAGTSGSRSSPPSLDHAPPTRQFSSSRATIRPAPPRRRRGQTIRGVQGPSPHHVHYLPLALQCVHHHQDQSQGYQARAEICLKKQENILKLELKKLKSVPGSYPMKGRNRGPSSQILRPPTGISGSRSSPCTYSPPRTPMCPPSPPGRPWRKKEHCTTSMPAKTLPETKKAILMEL